MPEVRLVRNLHSGQRKIWKELVDPENRFTSVVAGRRWGKGEVAAERIRHGALHAVGDYAFLAPTYRQGKQIVWGKLLRRFPREILRRAPNETSLMLELVNGSRVVVLGADKPDSLRGWDRGLRGVVLDEYDLFKNLAFEEVVRPMLADWRGWALFTGTPAGFKNLYEYWKRGQEKRAGWKSFRTFKSIENPWIDPQEIEDASFVAPAGTIYDDFSRELNAGLPCPFDKALPVVIGMDFNVDPMTAVMIQAHGPELWVPWCIEQPNSHTSRLAGVLHEKLKELYGGERYPEPELWVDPSGRARQQNIGTSDVEILRRAGFDVHYRPIYAESDKFNSVRAYVLNAEGKRRLRIDPGLDRLIERMEQLAPGDSDDHLTDALAYPIYGKFYPDLEASWAA